MNVGAKGKREMELKQFINFKLGPSFRGKGEQKSVPAIVGRWNIMRLSFLLNKRLPIVPNPIAFQVPKLFKSKVWPNNSYSL